MLYSVQFIFFYQHVMLYYEIELAVFAARYYLANAGRGRNINRNVMNLFLKCNAWNPITNDEHKYKYFKFVTHRIVTQQVFIILFLYSYYLLFLVRLAKFKHVDIRVGAGPTDTETPGTREKRFPDTFVEWQLRILYNKIVW